jgi:copper chaperone CopZ
MCSGPECSVVYFNDEAQIPLSEVSTAPFHKSDSPQRLVCFCFQHSVRAVQRDLAEHGESTIRASIQRRCRAGEDECKTKNPQGRCCLGNVGSVIKAPDSTDDSCCDTGCETPKEQKDVEVSSASPRSRDGVGFGAAIGLAALSSACCWVPAAGILLGVSTAGLGAAFAPWRIPALVLSVIFLVGALFFRNRAHRSACETGSCDSAGQRAWFMPGLVAATVLMLGLYPVYVPTDETEQPPHDEPPASLITYPIEGMTCGGCESHVEAAFVEIEGVASVDASYRDGVIVVGWLDEPDVAAIDNALHALGYVRTESGEQR